MRMSENEASICRRQLVDGSKKFKVLRKINYVNISIKLKFNNNFDMWSALGTSILIIAEQISY